MSASPDPKLAFGVEPSRRRFRLRLARYPAQARALANRLGEAPRILDAGCGKGRLPLYWRRFGRGAPTFVGLDVSPPRLARAAERGYALLLQADMRARWPVESGRFDAVALEQVLEHLDDAEVAHALDEAFRAVRPGGLVVVGVPLFTRFRRAFLPLARPLHQALRAHRGREEETHLQHFTLPELLALLQGRGLAVEEVFGVRLFALPRNWLEDSRAWHRLHGWLGRHVPGLCGEVTVVARTPREPGYLPQESPLPQGSRSGSVQPAPLA